jgi:hypothetical protein
MRRTRVPVLTRLVVGSAPAPAAQDYGSQIKLALPGSRTVGSQVRDLRSLKIELLGCSCAGEASRGPSSKDVHVSALHTWIILGIMLGYSG